MKDGLDRKEGRRGEGFFFFCLFFFVLKRGREVGILDWVSRGEDPGIFASPVEAEHLYIYLSYIYVFVWEKRATCGEKGREANESSLEREAVIVRCVWRTLKPLLASSRGRPNAIRLGVQLGAVSPETRTTRSLSLGELGFYLKV